MRILTLTAAILALCMAGSAQRSRYTSPEAKCAAKINGKEVRVDYYAPSMHGRKVMGGLVPYGKVWCTGANIATGITFPTDAQIGNLRVPKGVYSIWTIPNEKDWTLIINKESGQFHLDYNSSLDLGRTPMNVRTLPEPVETFRIDVRNDGGNKGTLALLWERTEASVPFTLLP